MKPFSRYELSEVISKRTHEIKQYIISLSDEIVMSGNDETILHNLQEKHRFTLVKILGELVDRTEIKQEKIKEFNRFYQRKSFLNEPEYYYSDGISVSKSFNFEGDHILFESKSNVHSISGYPNIKIQDNILTLTSSEKLETMKNPENKTLLFSRIDKNLETITTFINHCNSMADKFNNNIKIIGQSELEKRKDKIGSFYDIAKMLEIPIDIAEPEIIEVIDTKPNILPLSDIVSNQVNYSISDDIYNGILDLIRHVCASFERTPHTFSLHDEEGLRDIILSQLNGVFRGKATGEAFRKSGKTDITIEFEDRSAFVTECKIWSGIKSFESALDQLFRYLTWRDTKLCLIMFSKNKKFSSILETIESNFESMDNFISYEKINKNEFEAKFKSNDIDQVLLVRIFVFDLFVTPNVT